MKFKAMRFDTQGIVSNSEAIQGRLFNLGYRWETSSGRRSDLTEARFVYARYLFTYEDGSIMHSNSFGVFCDSKNKIETLKTI